MSGMGRTSHAASMLCFISAVAVFHLPSRIEIDSATERHWKEVIRFRISGLLRRVRNPPHEKYAPRAIVADQEHEWVIGAKDDRRLWPLHRQRP
jgi:hypothetical protein